MERQIAKISKATLEIKERGILNFWIYVDYEEGCSQGVGGYALDEYSKQHERRIGTAYGCELIRQLLVELAVNDFSEMKGKHIWVMGEGSGLMFKPMGIKAMNVDNSNSKGVIFDDVYKMFSKGEE